jgi:DNA-binding MarR family transcriptional regulator
MTDADIRPLGLDEQICFAIYSASRSLTARYRDLLAPLGLTYPQYLAMLVLWRSEPVTVRELGQRLQLDSGTLSPLVRRLEQAALVTKTRSAADERSVLIALTADGRDLEALAADIPNRICAATGLDLDGVVALRDQLIELTQNVRGSLEPAV